MLLFISICSCVVVILGHFFSWDLIASLLLIPVMVPVLDVFLIYKDLKDGEKKEPCKKIIEKPAIFIIIQILLICFMIVFLIFREWWFFVVILTISLISILEVHKSIRDKKQTGQ
jgi:hypothetical protein